MDDDSTINTLLFVYRDLAQGVLPGVAASGTWQVVTAVASRVIPNVDAASITRRRAGLFDTAGSTATAATVADALQYALGSGPCVDAVVTERVFHSHDLAIDPRWLRFGPLAATEVGVRSVLSIRLTPDHDDTDLGAGLNLYSYRPDAFDDQTRQLAVLLATQAGVVISRHKFREKAANLEAALANSREIGIAIGVLMHTHKFTREDAFDVLRSASQRGHRKLSDVATEVADTGTLNLPHHPPTPPGS